VPETSSIDASEELVRGWDAVTLALRRDVTDFTFHIWLEPLIPAARVGDTLFVRAPDHIRTWVEESFLALLHRTAAGAIGASAVQIVDMDWVPPAGAADAKPGEVGAGSPDLNPSYTFDHFVICDGNRLAHGAALAAAEQPGQAYNPLFIHGRPGLGKTHLLHAIGNYVHLYGDGLTVRYVTVEEFTAEFVRAVRTGDSAAFRHRFRDADVLLVDDVQFLAAKLRTEEEFFHTFNALHESGSQLVITSDRRPRDIESLEIRLRERFECGLVADLEPPDFSARLAILQQRARLDAAAAIPAETLSEIAARITSSVRALEGALVRVVAYASLHDRRPTPDVARHVLRYMQPRGERARATLGDIQSASAAALDVPADALIAKDRRPRVALARQIAMYLARELTDASLPAIGRHFGGRNHSTVLHAHRRIAGDLAEDSETTEAVKRAQDTLAPAGDDRRR